MEGNEEMRMKKCPICGDVSEIDPNGYDFKPYKINRCVKCGKDIGCDWVVVEVDENGEIEYKVKE